MRTRILAFALVGLAAAAALSAQSLTQVNHLTFRQTVALPGVVLPPGSYSFELNVSAHNVVRVMTRDRQQHVFLGMTVPVERPAGPRGARVLLGEAPAGQPMPIRVWYPANSPNGYRFLY
ncbi:MAG: hypothetical protein HYU37_02145 [Acidobacteria bacterium]|nr:hypothetical protein [Acidobacteriota bacterium]